MLESMRLQFSQLTRLSTQTEQEIPSLEVSYLKLFKVKIWRLLLEQVSGYPVKSFKDQVAHSQKKTHSHLVNEKINEQT